MLDASFGAGGHVLVPGTNCSGLAIDAAGRIVIGGLSVNGGAFAARLLTDGTLDASFGAGGLVVMDLPPWAPPSSYMIVHGRRGVVSSPIFREIASPGSDFGASRPPRRVGSGRPSPIQRPPPAGGCKGSPHVHQRTMIFVKVCRAHLRSSD